MKLLKLCVPIIFCFSIMRCTSTRQFEKVPPTEFSEVYYQAWNSGIEEGGSGISIYINIKEQSVAFDSIYFRGMVTKLSPSPNNLLLYVGRFKLRHNNSNEVTKGLNKTFKLKDNQAVVSYFKKGKVCYYKIDAMEKRDIINYPSTPENKN